MSTFAPRLLANAEWNADDGQVRVAHRATEISDIPICGARLSTICVLRDAELDPRHKRQRYRLCANCQRKADKHDLAAVRETLPSTHVTAAAYGTLSIDRVDRETARRLSNRSGRGALRAYLKAWGYVPEGSNA